MEGSAKASCTLKRTWFHQGLDGKTYIIIWYIQILLQNLSIPIHHQCQIIIQVCYCLLSFLQFKAHIQMRVLGNVIKSQSDNRLYKAIKLKNDIECLIISDQQAKRSSAALSVGVGSLQDPIDAQGLAHYLQHMLFMGTQKYPNENDYSDFIAKNFGQSNAYTSQQQTNYHFEVSSNAFEETLDRFAQFFISPLMSDSSSERQLNAVHSEHSKNILNDSWRKYQLTKFLAKQNHPFKKFSTGNKQSLSNPNLRQMLHNFYANHYSSNLMKLVVCGNQNPDHMSKIIEQKFSQVPNKNYSKYQMLDLPYAQNFYQKFYKVSPIQDKKVLQLSWTLKDKSSFYENPPSSYVSYIVGHEGKGSLLSFLIGEGLATSLAAGGHDSFNCFSEFQIRISLTKKGVQNVRQVIQYTLYFIEMIKRAQPQKWVFDQMKNLYKMRFDYLEKLQGMQYTSGLAKKLQNRKIQQVVAYPFFMKEWRPDLIKGYLNQIAKENLVVFLQAKQLQNQCNLIQPIYQTKFAVSDLDVLEPRVCPVTLPQKNPFIPTNFQILPMGQQTIPKSLYKSDQFEVFYKKDHRFQLPKMLIFLRLYFAGNNSVKQSVCRKIYLDMLTQKMRQFVYLGDSAQTNSGIDFDSYFTLDIAFQGFRDSTLKYVKPYLLQVFQFQPTDQKYFETVKQKYERSLSNYFLGDPFRMAYNLTMMATRHGVSTSPLQQLAELKNITIEDIANFGRTWNKKLYVQAYISGNLNEEQAKQTLSQVEKVIKQKSQMLSKGLIGQIRAVKLPSQYIWAIEQKITNESQQNSAVVVHFQHEASMIRSKVLQDLCYNFIKQPAFDYLRTKQQLGYIVMCLPDDNRGVLGMSILLQSAIKTSYQLIQYVDIFVAEILAQKLKELDQDTFQQYKTSLKTSKLEKDKNLSVESSKFWSQITKHRYQFTKKQKQIEQLDSITLSEFKNFVNLIFYINPKRLEIHLISQKATDKNDQAKKQRLSKKDNLRVFPNAESFKKKMDLYPDFYSHL